jgi:hypothetical protein
MISAVSVVVTSALAAGCSSGTGSAALTSVAAAPEEPDITQLAGQVDISAGSYVAYLAVQAAGARFRVLAEASTLAPDTRASAHGISPSAVTFVTDPDGFPAMPGTPQQEAWSAVFLAEPYITAAGQQYGQQVLADLDQGAVMSLPVDGYVATQAWARVHPATTSCRPR